MRLSHTAEEEVQIVGMPAPTLAHQRAVQAIHVVLGPRTPVKPDVFVVRREPGVRLEAWAHSEITR